MTAQNNRLGILLMIGAFLCYTIQDGITRHLAGEYSVFMTIMIRYWFFAVFVIGLGLMRPGGIRRAVKTRRAGLLTLRSVLHISEILLIVASFTLIGLINTHAIFAVCPLMVAAMSGPILGEKVGLMRWIAIGAGFMGILVILQPGSDLFTPLAALPLLSALLFAAYSVLTRLATRDEDPFIAFFWAGVLGFVFTTAIGIWFWEPMSQGDWAWTVGNGLVAILSNWLMIRGYAKAEASVIQPFAYLQLVFVTIMGVTVFAEPLQTETMIGAIIVVASGLLTLVKLPKRT